jgi:hypothetical protein
MQQNEVVMNNTAIKSSEQRSNVEIDLEDGPLFRATIKEYESRTSILKGYLKRILKTAASSLEAKNNLLEQDKLFIEALREAPFTEPLFAHYLNSTWDKLHEEQERLSFCMQNLLISPLQKLYDMDIKTVDNKKRQFEDVSKEYYSNLSRYLSIKTPNTNVTSANSTSNMNNSNTNNTTATVTATTTNTALNTDITKLLKEKRNQKAESEFLTKKSEFDLVRFDYYTFLRDLHGGKKEQEILYHLLNHHEKQYAYYQSVAKLLEPYKEGLDELANMIAEASREQKIVNQERDEKRKLLVSKYATTPNDDSVTKMERRKSSNGASSSILSPTPFMTPISPNTSQSNSPLHSPPINTDSISEEPAIGLGITNVDQNNKFKGIRDLQQQDQDLKNSSGRRKEGFLFATSKPIKNTNATAFDMSSNVNWHK